MITSDRQYAVAKKQRAMLMDSLVLPEKKDVPIVIKQAGKAQIQELIDEIQVPYYAPEVNLEQYNHGCAELGFCFQPHPVDHGGYFPAHKAG